MANNTGRDAKSSSRRCFTLVKVTTPMAPRTPLPTKFAVAEKHIAGLLLDCEACDFASQNGDGSFGQREYRLCGGVDARDDRRQVWIGVCGGVCAVPNVLLAAQCDHANRAGKI